MKIDVFFCQLFLKPRSKNQNLTVTFLQYLLCFPSKRAWKKILSVGKQPCYHHKSLMPPPQTPHSIKKSLWWFHKFPTNIPLPKPPPQKKFLFSIFHSLQVLVRPPPPRLIMQVREGVILKIKRLYYGFSLKKVDARELLIFLRLRDAMATHQLQISSYKKAIHFIT